MKPEDREKKQETKKFHIPKWLVITSAIFLFLILTVSGTVLAFEQVYETKIFPGVRIGALDLGGKTADKAFEEIRVAADKISENGLVFQYLNNKITVLPVLSASDPDLSQEVFSININQTVSQAFNVGRTNDYPASLAEQLKSLFFSRNLTADFKINETELESILKSSFAKYEKPAVNASLKFYGENKITVVSEKEGSVFDYASILKNANYNLSQLTDEPIFLNLIKEEPKIKSKDTDEAAKMALSIIEREPPILTYQGEKWFLPKDGWKEYLDFVLAESDDDSTNLDDKRIESEPEIKIFFDLDTFSEFLKKVAKKINIEPKEAKFAIESGKVKEFQASRDGLSLDFEETTNKINQEFILNSQKEIEVIVKVEKPKITTENINNFGIKEIIGVGKSDFSGSPVNRRHNIRVGASTLHGLLIKPGEEFSLVTALGDISAKTGYLPELVIRGDETVPEYGGGLCQIGTTMFRVALDAGLPITDRTPHSYRVVYYEPAGTDATIYNPRPDLKFINDTGHYILIQSLVDGNELSFTFWGTSDGRKVEQTKPIIYNLKSPPPLKEIESDSLKPGEKKCTERAHTGADTYFKRTITFIDGTIKEEDWYSHYRPWQAVCLVGKEPGTDVPADQEGPAPDQNGTQPDGQTGTNNNAGMTNSNNNNSSNNTSLINGVIENNNSN